MRLHIRRTGIAALVVTLVTSLLSTTQAGVIPWLYDAIFGPVYPHYYGGYSPGWSASGYGCAPARCAPCNPCRVGYAPQVSAPCSTGACSTIAFYGPCGTQCSTEVACRGVTKADVGKLAPQPDKLPPAPKTFDQAPKPGAEKRDLKHSQPTVSGVAASAGAEAATAKDDAGFEAGARGDVSIDEFAPPLIRSEDGASDAVEVEEAAPSTDTLLDPALDLDNRTSWMAPLSKERIGMRAGFRNARIARHAQTLERDYVIPVRSTAQIAGK